MEKQTINSAQKQPASPSGATFSSPAPVGCTVKTIIEGGHAYLTPRLYNLEITLLDVLRGKQAVEWLISGGVDPGLFQPGQEYILAHLNFAFFQRGRGGDDEVYQLPSGQFAVISADGKTEYAVPQLSNRIKPQLAGWSFHPGESRQGWLLFQVDVNDPQPRLIFKREHVEGVYGIWGYVWFQLY
jgi:hypothetical protein